MEIKAFTSVLSAPATAAGLSRAVAGKNAAQGTASDAGQQKAEDVELARREEALRAAREATRVAAARFHSGGSIEFEQQEGTRVMRVLDSKDVLIYQMPPKGQLMLVRAEDVDAGHAIDRA
ncbi:MAG: hypothetical protein FD187_2288 [bacterium]|nr:MAG: hypothetical protein FD142_2811 [bacterium]KAF0148075.1 MAG: hypothetical protein FD187_2288 [bacterium]KAF0167591.1 MAG: hypothetical protein FD158_2169 [bacterium]TXT16103.1 MAG: hypothetical protein FD132_3022 [bacterium]